MFEIFMLTTLLAIGLSQLIPESANTPGSRRIDNKSKKSKSRSDKGRKYKIKTNVNRRQHRSQAHSSRTLQNSSGGIGRLKKKPCIW